MRRQEVAVRLLAVLLCLVVAASLIVALLERWRESVETKQAKESAESWKEWGERLVRWVEEIRLRYGVEEEPPAAPATEEGSVFELENKLEAGGAVTAAGITYAGGFDWRATIAAVTAPGWSFSDSPYEYIAWAMRESDNRGDPSGKDSHLWRTGQAIRNSGQTYPMSEGYRQAARWLYAATCIDDYLRSRGSPLVGFGIDFILSGVHFGVNPYLMVALTAAESTYATDGSLCRTHHNAWGMKGPNKTGLEARGGWMWWPDWPSAVWGAAYFVSVYWPGARNAYDLRGYCEGNPPAWIRNVEGVRLQLEYLGGEL